MSHDGISEFSFFSIWQLFGLNIIYYISIFQDGSNPNLIDEKASARISLYLSLKSK